MSDGLTELQAMQEAYKALDPLETDQRARALFWLAQTLGVQLGPGGARASTTGGIPPPTGETLDSIPDSDMSPKEFMLAKRPNTVSERMACLGYYLATVKGQPKFKTTDISALAMEAAQPKFSNASRDVDNAERSAGFVVTAGKGLKQLTPRGEAVVNALPDRGAVQLAMTEHPHKRKKAPAKKSPSTEP